MGCDGGTIPRRDELVKVKKKAETKDKDFELAFQWRYCHLSQQLLQQPIVMCGLGHLYNKVALIEGLLDRQSLPESVRHIKNLRDVKNLNLTPNPEFKPADEMKEGGIDSRAAPYICPVIGLEMTGKHRFVALWSCGCVFSERALKEITTNVCHKCQAQFQDEDVVILNGDKKDLPLLKSNMDRRQHKNKNKRDKPCTITSNALTLVTEVSNDDSKLSKPSACNPSSSSSTVPSNKRQNLAVSGQLSLKRKESEENLKDRAKKVKGNYSVAKDPQASDVYKSLFTSHQSEQQQNRAHWITYNPFYN